MPDDAPRIPLAVKLALTGFTAVLVPKYWIDYGPTNFLYFCDVALLMTVVAVWRESPLLVSMPAVGIVFPQIIWTVDFLGECVGLPLSGVTGYMFDAKIPLFTRGLSSFHLWLPYLLLWLTWRLGYDRRALRYWTILAWIVLLVSYFLMPPPPAPLHDPNIPVNINYVYGFDSSAPQTWMPPLAYLALLMIAGPLLFFLPTHFVLAKLFGQVEKPQTSGAA
jgi:hypothetical protein